MQDIDTVEVREAYTFFPHLDMQLCLLHTQRPTVTKRTEYRMFYSICDGYDIRYYDTLSKAQQEHDAMLFQLKYPDTIQAPGTPLFDLYPEAPPEERYHQCNAYGVRRHKQSVPIYTLHFQSEHNTRTTEEYLDPNLLERSLVLQYGVLIFQENTIARRHGFQQLWRAMLKPRFWQLVQWFGLEGLKQLCDTHLLETRNMVYAETNHLAAAMQRHMYGKGISHSDFDITPHVEKCKNLLQHYFYQKLAEALEPYQHKFVTYPMDWIISLAWDIHAFEQNMRSYTTVLKEKFVSEVAHITPDSLKEEMYDHTIP